MNYPNYTKSTRSGFSLIEILVVVALIGVLVMLVYPFLSSAWDRANQSSCQAKLREIGKTLLLYATDNQGSLPPASQGPFGYWYSLLEPYFGYHHVTIYDLPRPDWQMCPAKKVEPVNHEVIGYGWNHSAFGNNTWGVPGTPGWENTKMSFAKLSDVPEPESTVIIGDSKDLDVAPEKAWEHRYIYRASGFWYTHAKRHQGGGNYLFVDGHVEWFTPENLRAQLPYLFDRYKE